MAGFDLADYRSNDEPVVETFDVNLGKTKDEHGNPIDEIIHIPPSRKWPIEAQEAMAKGEVVEGIRLIAGDEAADLFEDYEWTFGEFDALFEALAKWSGFGTGRSSNRQQRRASTRR